MISRWGHVRTATAFATVLLCVLWLWHRSHSHGHVLALLAHDAKVSGVLSSKGQLWFVVTNVSLGAERAWTIEAHPVSDADAEGVVRLLAARAEHQKMAGRFSWARGTFQEVAGSWFFAATAPHWFLAVLLALPPLLWVRRRWMLWRRGRTGLCLGCGYDLRFSGGRCPECGWEREACPAALGTPV